MADEVVLRLDRTSAKYLAGMLYDVGEHLAAGAPIAPMSTDESERLAAVLHELWRALGIPLPYGTDSGSAEPSRRRQSAGSQQNSRCTTDNSDEER